MMRRFASDFSCSSQYTAIVTVVLLTFGVLSFRFPGVSSVLSLALVSMSLEDTSELARCCLESCMSCYLSADEWDYNHLALFKNCCHFKHWD